MRLPFTPGLLLDLQQDLFSMTQVGAVFCSPPPGLYPPLPEPGSEAQGPVTHICSIFRTLEQLCPAPLTLTLRPPGEQSEKQLVLLGGPLSRLSEGAASSCNCGPHAKATGHGAWAECPHAPAWKGTCSVLVCRVGAPHRLCRRSQNSEIQGKAARPTVMFSSWSRFPASLLS